MPQFDSLHHLRHNKSSDFIAGFLSVKLTDKTIVNKENALLKITHLKTNHVQNPLGFVLEPLVFSWIVEDTPDKKQISQQVLTPKDDTFKRNIFDTNFS